MPNTKKRKANLPVGDVSLSKVNFFVCSTYEDLKVHRDAVIKKIVGHAGVINAQEFFGSRDKKPLATCIEEVDKSNVFILILGPRYGTVDVESGKSFVECEYARARKNKLPVFAYLIDRDAIFPIKYVADGEDAKHLRAFKRQVELKHTVSYFSGPDDLAAKVYADLVRELPKFGFRLGDPKSEDEESAARILLPKFVALPKLFQGRTTRLSVRLGKWQRAEKHVCEAFSFDYGSAISRSFKMMDGKQEIRSSFGEIYAEDEGALKLIDAPEATNIDVIVKTIQGEYEIKTPVYGFDFEPSVMNQYMNDFRDRRRVVTEMRGERHLVCGLQFVEFVNEASK